MKNILSILKKIMNVFIRTIKILFLIYVGLKLILITNGILIRPGCSSRETTCELMELFGKECPRTRDYYIFDPDRYLWNYIHPRRLFDSELEILNESKESRHRCYLPIYLESLL